MIDALPYIFLYTIVFGYPIYTVYTAFIRKAPVMESDELVKRWIMLQEIKK